MVEKPHCLFLVVQTSSNFQTSRKGSSRRSLWAPLSVIRDWGLSSFLDSPDHDYFQIHHFFCSGVLNSAHGTALHHALKKLSHMLGKHIAHGRWSWKQVLNMRSPRKFYPWELNKMLNNPEQSKYAPTFFPILFAPFQLFIHWFGHQRSLSSHRIRRTDAYRH